MNFINKSVTDKGSVDGKNTNFHPDSSLEAWEHYRKVYFNENGVCKISEQYTLENLESLVLCNYKNKTYYNEPKERWPYDNRYYLLSGNNLIKYQLGDTYPGENANLSGDCDFNFNPKKYSIFKRMIEEKYEEGSRMCKYSMSLLEECRETHHKLVNFSLMQTKGDMQGFKGWCLNNGVYASLDRADTFIAYLNSYYELQDVQKDDSYILTNAGSNKETLKEYLKSFEDIYEYCEKIYLINDKEFINRMIREGKCLIKTGHDVIRYMLLALEFWDRKELQIKEIYKNI
ncbi:hypothetical protein [Metasolibacillus sp. FSL K6-0083]|uniref:hypothetical protein n=1 Tax=Metasolibacillus sp. FSL K6-0083 TaxID=2921416 RepID=UPI00315A20BE